MLMSECSGSDEIYTHIDEDTVTVRHFNATKMAAYAEAGILEGSVRLLRVAMDPTFVDFVRTRRGVEQWKLDRLEEPYLSTPVIGAVFGDSVLTVDGHHRLVRLHELGAQEYGIYLFSEGSWDRFLLTDIPEGFDAYLTDITQRQLATR